ncbi:MAG: hypothetical protein WDA02_06975 [Saccharofermentanales bacterium]
MKRPALTLGPRLKAAGSVSLALCLIMPVILLFMASLLFHSRRTRAETDLIRGAVLAAEGALALYDRELYRDFGLFACDQASMDKSLSSLIGPGQEATFRLEAQEALTEAQVLKDAVARHMTLRAASSLVMDGLDKVRQIKGMEKELPAAALTSLIPSSANQGYAAVDPELDLDPEETPWLDDYNAYMDDQVRSVYQTGLTMLAPAVQPSEDGSMRTFEFNPFDNSGLDSLGLLVDRLLFTAPEGFLDRFILCEYAFSYFKSDVPLVLRNGVKIQDRTPDGRLIADFPASRNQEVEEIASGLQGPAASALVGLFIGSIRFVLRLLHIITNEGLMEEYRMTALAISVAISALSAGEVNIPPEVMTWILVAAVSLSKAAADTMDLRKGHEINLWPGDSPLNVPMRYRDYLRLLILFQGPDVIASRMAGVIARTHPGPYYTRIQCLADWSDIRLSHAVSFLTRERPEDQP